MARAPSLELVVAGVLVAGVGALGATRLASPAGTGPGGMDALVARADLASLRCLKRAVELQDPQPGEAFEPTQADVRRLAARVAEVRQLPFSDVPEPDFVPTLDGDDEGWLDEEDVLRDEIVLRALGVLGDEVDLASFYGGEPLGTYLPETGEVVVATDAGSVEHTTAHELAHALTDQAIGFPEPEGTPRDLDEEDFALAALIEGDATFTASLVSPMSAFENIATVIAVPFAGSGDSPHLVVREGMFPYVEGLGFVCSLWSRGGWAAVNEAYSRPPTSTDQVLFPERYFSGSEPSDPRDPPRPEGWTALSTDPWGAAALLFLFEAPGDDLSRGLDSARERAKAWGGGEVHVSLNDADAAVGLTLVERPGERSLCRSMAEWYAAAFPEELELPTVTQERLARAGDGRFASLRCRGRDVRLGIGPDMRVARAMSS
ncbi:MAG TPA: hypothetical protein VEA19_05590 [Actinomycetota bacterium]|nr:hypothetical protein [Actinomycetota bacterium]